MASKARKATVKASKAIGPAEAKIKAKIAKKQVPTAASSRSRRRASKPIDNELKDGPKSSNSVPKRKQPIAGWETEEEEAKKKGNTKKHSWDSAAGKVSATTDYDGHEEITIKQTAAIDITTKLNRDRNFWLMKAEPLSRMEKGKDVKFSIDDLKTAKEPEGWDGKTCDHQLICSVPN